MFGSYTAFELEAERRREVLASTMREVHGSQPADDDPCQHTQRPLHASAEQRVSTIASSLLSRVTQRT
jgi:hypothetical protein